jgi:preprotein translocase subunit SecG
MLLFLLKSLHVLVCAILIFVVLLQQGRGGGMGATFGGGGATQVFGGRGAGNLLTRTTSICAGLFMLTSVTLAYKSSEGDRELKQRAAQEAKKSHGDKGTARPKDSAAAGAPSGAAPADKPADTAPADSTAPATPANPPSPATPGSAPAP